MRTKSGRGRLTESNARSHLLIDDDDNTLLGSRTCGPPILQLSLRVIECWTEWCQWSAMQHDNLVRGFCSRYDTKLYNNERSAIQSTKQN